MAIHFELLNRQNLEDLRKLRNENREWFINSKEISYEEQWVWFLNRGYITQEFIFLIKDSNLPNKYIGAISLYNVNSDGHFANIGRMMVANEFKHQGYMKRAMILMFEFAQKFLGIRELTLEVKNSNIIARDFYTKMGFITYGITKDTLIMRKVLN